MIEQSHIISALRSIFAPTERRRMRRAIVVGPPRSRGERSRRLAFSPSTHGPASWWPEVFIVRANEMAGELPAEGVAR